MVLLALGLATGASRLAFVRATPINWDAVQFSLALGRFDLHSHQPHPPGYILYVAMGRAVNALVGNADLSLSLLSVAFSIAAGILIYRLGLSIFEDRGVALGAAVLLLGSPLALYYGSVGLTYAPELAFSIAVAALAWRVKQSPSVANAALLGAVLGIAGGVRQTSLVVLLPVCLWALFESKRSRREWAAFFGVLTSVCLAWLVPLLWLSGGIGAYMHESTLLAQAASKETSITSAGLEGLLNNAAFEGLGLALGLGFAMVPLGLWALRVVRFSLSRDLKLFAAWWALPAVCLYAVSHVGQYGYALVCLPPLLLLSALCVRVVAERLKDENGGLRAAVGACAALALASGAYFALAQGPTTAANISENDLHWREVASRLAGLDPARTALIGSSKWDGPFRQAGYLLPDFYMYAEGKGSDQKVGWLYSAYGGGSTYSLPHPLAREYLSLPGGVRNIVALDDETGKMLEIGAQSVQRVPLADGSSLYVARAPTDLAGLAIDNLSITPVGGQVLP